ncbi:MAG: hypothetical protein R2795_01800 [Saprospiraceae bacterium]
MVLTTFTVYESAPATGSQLNTTEETVVVPQLTTGACKGDSTVIVWVVVVEVQPLSVTERLILFTPLVDQLTVCGPWPIPGIAVAPAKSQL